ncbi:MAG: hypothetical protein PHO41_00815 [Eubacteriales bacterium]|nr:hypothetical protein [Eubacteriales bacterium]
MIGHDRIFNNARYSAYILFNNITAGRQHNVWGDVVIAPYNCAKQRRSSLGAYGNKVCAIITVIVA